jgi:hypothetical protein
LERDAMSRPSHLYSVYGVAIKSDWPLAFPTALDRTANMAEVEFVEGTDEDFSDADAFSDPAGPWFQSHVFPDQSTYVRWSGLYEFRIPADGSRVACRALDGCDPIVLQSYLFGQALSFALVQQGLEPLHAAAVRVDDVAVGFLGDCAFGKSTLLASFLQAGHGALTDDLLMLMVKDGQAAALPGTGRIKLRPDSAGALLDGTAEGWPLNSGTLKRSFPVAAAQVQQTALPLKQLFFLSTPEERKHMKSIEIQPLSRPAMFQQLLKNSFNIEILTRQRVERQFAYLAMLASSLDGFLLRYPDGMHHLPLVRQSIVDHIRRTVVVHRRPIQ